MINGVIHITVIDKSDKTFIVFANEINDLFMYQKNSRLVKAVIQIKKNYFHF